MREADGSGGPQHGEVAAGGRGGRTEFWFEGVEAIYERSRLLRQASGRGAMAAVG